MTRFDPDYSRRLAHYRVDETTKPLQRADQDTDAVHWDDHVCPFALHQVTTNCLDEVKDLIGNPDSSFAADESAPAAHGMLSAKKSLSREECGAAAMAYVFGNSAPLRQHKSAIEQVLGSMEVQVVAQKVVVIDKPIVISGTKPKAIAADKLIFKGNGQIKNIGILTINAGLIQNNT